LPTSLTAWVNAEVGCSHRGICARWKPSAEWLSSTTDVRSSRQNRISRGLPSNTADRLDSPSFTRRSRFAGGNILEPAARRRGNKTADIRAPIRNAAETAIDADGYLVLQRQPHRADIAGPQERRVPAHACCSVAVQRVRALVGTLEPIGVPVHAIAHQARRPVLPVSIAMVPLLAMTVHTATIGGASSAFAHRGNFTVHFCMPTGLRWLPLAAFFIV